MTLSRIELLQHFPQCTLLHGRCSMRNTSDYIIVTGEDAPFFGGFRNHATNHRISGMIICDNAPLQRLNWFKVVVILSEDIKGLVADGLHFICVYVEDNVGRFG